MARMKFLLLGMPSFAARCKEIIISRGPICVPFSMMGKRLQTEDHRFGTHTAYFENIAVDQDLNIIENVTEYNLEILEHALPGFSLSPLKIDPRVFGLGAARTRLYVIAIRIGKLKWKDNFSLVEFFDVLTSQVVLSASKYYWMNLPASILSPSDETCLRKDFFLSPIDSHQLHVAHVAEYSCFQARNLAEYQTMKRDYMFPDLTQLARNKRGRGETVDGALPTLTTNSGKLYAKAW